MRADAERNRQRIMDAALEVFAERGAHAPMESIARRAGLGIGTFYRHFPTREDLLMTLLGPWAEDVELSCTAVIANSATPRTMLTRWLTEYVARVRIYRDCTAGLVGALDDRSSPMWPKCEVLNRSTDRVLAACGPAVRGDIDALAVNRLAGGVAIVADVSDLSEAEIGALLEQLIDSIMVNASPERDARSEWSDHRRHLANR